MISPVATKCKQRIIFGPFQLFVGSIRPVMMTNESNCVILKFTAIEWTVCYSWNEDTIASSYKVWFKPSCIKIFLYAFFWHNFLTCFEVLIKMQFSNMSLARARRPPGGECNCLRSPIHPGNVFGLHNILFIIERLD